MTDQQRTEAAPTGDHTRDRLADIAQRYADQLTDTIATLPQTSITLQGTFDIGAIERLAKQLPLSADLVGGSLDGIRWLFEPGSAYPEMLAIEMASVTHFYRRVECDWWTAYEWVTDRERPSSPWQ